MWAWWAVAEVGMQRLKGLLHVAQDNIPSGPIFKARLLHIRIIVDIKQGAVGKISPTAFQKRVCWYWNRAGCGATELENRSWGWGILCHIR